MHYYTPTTILKLDFGLFTIDFNNETTRYGHPTYSAYINNSKICSAIDL